MTPFLSLFACGSVGEPPVRSRCAVEAAANDEAARFTVMIENHSEVPIGVVTSGSGQANIEIWEHGVARIVGGYRAPFTSRPTTLRPEVVWLESGERHSRSYVFALPINQSHPDDLPFYPVSEVSEIDGFWTGLSESGRVIEGGVVDPNTQRGADIVESLVLFRCEVSGAEQLLRVNEEKVTEHCRSASPSVPCMVE